MHNNLTKILWAIYLTVLKFTNTILKLDRFLLFNKEFFTILRITVLLMFPVKKSKVM